MRTALEDFVAASHLEWQLFFLPGFNGLGLAVTNDRLAESEELQRAIKSLETAPFLTRWAQVIELARGSAELAAHRRDSEHMRIQNDLTEDRDQLSKLLVDAETRLAGVPDLQVQIANLARDVKEARSAASEQARALDEHLTMSAQVLSDVMNSPSWRLTKPLRTAKHFLRR